LSSELPAGTTKLGKYVLERRIASGGMADVYAARHVGAFGFSKNVAIKVLKESVSDQSDNVRMFLREAMVAADFKHPNLVQVYEVGEEGGKLFLAMELVRGISLATLMQLLAQKRRSVPIALAVHIVRNALDGLAHAHEAVGAEGQQLRLVHRDVTPQNILVDTMGIVKVVDFGIARAETRAGRTQGAHIKGKFGYMSPEQWETSRELDARADLFSAGVVLYEMSTGSRKLFRGNSVPELYRAIVRDPIAPPTRVVPDYPSDLAEVIMKALSRDVAARWESARAMRDALDEVIRANDWIATNDDLARLVSKALNGQSIEDTWERLTSDESHDPTASNDVAIVAMASMEASRAPNQRTSPAGLSGPYPAVTPRDGLAISVATVSARPASLHLQSEPSPTPSSLSPTSLKVARDANVPAAAPIERSSLVWKGAALAGWLVAVAMATTWWRTREQLHSVVSTPPIAVVSPPTPIRVMPEPLGFLSDVSLADNIAMPWADIAQSELNGFAVHVDRGNALARLLQGSGNIALRAGVAEPTYITQAHALGIELRSSASEHVVGYDHVAVVVHPSSTVHTLDVQQVATLFGGGVLSHRSGHGNHSAPTTVVCGLGAPTRAFLDDYLLPLRDRHDVPSVTRDATVVANEQAAVSYVEQHPNTVALVRIAWVRSTVRVVAIATHGNHGGVVPTRETIRSAAYPLVRPLMIYTRGAAFGGNERLLRVALSPAGQTLIERAGYVSR
jgi:serine/threonine protein kinase